MTVTPQISTFEKNNASFDTDRTIELLRERLAHERARCDRMALDLQNAQADVVAKNREIGRLKAEITKKEGTSATAREVRAVWDHYVAKVPVQKSGLVFGDGRKKMIRDRLRECRESGVEDPVGMLKRAIDGLAAKPYVRHGGGRSADSKGATRYAQLTHALRSDEQVAAAIGWLSPEAPKLPARRLQAVEDPPAEKVLNALRTLDLDYRAAWGAGSSSVGKWMAQCPAHDDRQASLSIREADDRVLLNCFAGCEVPAICEALGLRLSELFERRAA